MRLRQDMPLRYSYLSAEAASEAAGRIKLEPPKPPLPRQLLNAAKAVVRSAGQVASGRPLLVPDSIRDERAAICRKCEHYRQSDQACSKCGCGCAGRILNKTRFAAEHCPVNRWKIYNPNPLTKRHLR